MSLYQPLHNEPQRQQQLPSAPAIRERHATAQLMVAGIILIITGLLSVVFNFRGLVWLVPERAALIGHGFWCGITVGLILFIIIFYGAFCKCKL